MARKVTNTPIGELEEGDAVTGFALVTKKELRQDKNGRDYLDMEVVDATGLMVAKVWSDSPALRGDFAQHDFVAYRGTVNRFRDQLQLNIKDCRRVAEADRDHGFDESLIIPSTRYDIAQLDQRLQEIYSQEIVRPVLGELARKALEAHGDQLREHPAAKTIHHAYRGGLLEHTVSMAELGIQICDHYAELDRDLILIGVLFHDLGKLQEIGAMPVNDYTTVGRLVGHVVIGRDMLRECCRQIPDFPTDLQTHLEHLILSHQGRLEFGSPVQPMTAEAIALHFIDDLDSKLAQLRSASELGEPLQFLRGFGRYLYTGASSETEEEFRDSGGTEPTDAEPEVAENESPDQPTLDL
jgi:3'-5' exoribonuclease